VLTRSRFIATFGVIALLVIMSVPGAATAAAGRSAGVFPPHAKPFGHSYGEWTALWWQQALALHASEHPNAFDAGEVPCDLGTREVAFLVGTTGGKVKRACTIRQGQAVLFPLINGECSEIEGGGTTEAELRACAAAQADDFTKLRASVDGRKLEGLSSFRFQSPLFRFQSVSDNPFGVPATPLGEPSSAVADGYWIMLHPLGLGIHQINFRGSAPSFGFTTKAEYSVRVVGHSGSHGTSEAIRTPGGR
jgi:hypothetical protein